MKKLKFIFLITSSYLIISCNESSIEKNQNLEKFKKLEQTIKILEIENQNLEKNNNLLKSKLSNIKKEKQVYNEDFLSFVINFSENEKFQKERIEFPIEIEESYIGENDTIYNRTLENWDFKKYEFHPEGFNIYDNEKVKLRKSNHRILRWYGIESEGDLRFYFRGKKGKWFLYRISHSG